MRKYVVLAVLGIGVLALIGFLGAPTSFVGAEARDDAAKAGSAYAAATERTVTLAVNGMYCPSCVYIVRSTLAAVPGVSRVVVGPGTAVVTYDSTKTSVPALINATTQAGYPSARKT